MSRLIFPALNEVPFEAMSTLLTEINFSIDQDQSLHDLVCLLGEFFEQLSLFASDEANRIVTYDELENRSFLLLEWINIISRHFEKLTHLPAVQKKDLQIILNHLHIIYSHPLLTTIWLGLERVTTINNNKHETEFLQYIVVASHYDYEVLQQIRELIDLISPYVEVSHIVTMLQIAENTERIDTHFIKEFISHSASSIFRLAVLGKIDLLRSALEVYNYYLTYLDNMRLKNDYHAIYLQIINKLPKPYQQIESIYAKGKPIFDAHISKNKNGAFTIPQPDIEFPIIQPKKGIPPDIHMIYKKLKNNIAFVCKLRGRLLANKSQYYITMIEESLFQSILPEQKARYIEIATENWYAWVKKRYADDTILINECVSMASALAIKVKEQNAN